ncbi:MAG: class I SAM-dependent methyltransferase [Candidatus Omnitrophica bacterium]|nr:class I SAM-dependent methyltransferase [Candidatus Omnitrophota bacterium]
MNNKKQVKGLNKEHWSKNVPGLEQGKTESPEINKDFFKNVDRYRVANEPYVVPLIKELSGSKGRVLEVGCGLGADLRNFAERGMSAVGLDLSFDNVRLTKSGFNYCGLTGSMVNSDAENLPFKDNCFDAYYSFGVLHHTPDTSKAVDEAYRVLKNGGKCTIMLYHKGYAYLYINLRFGFKRLFISEEKLISEHYDFTPLSKMFSRKDATPLFKKFKKIDFEVTTFAYGGVDVNSKLKWLHRLLGNKFLMNRLGQFLVIKAEK